MKKILLKLIVILVTIGIIYNGYEMVKEFTKPNKIETIKTVDIFDNKDKTLSIMLQEDGTNFTEATDRSKWPDVASYIFDKAECTDSTGAVIDYKSILTFNLDTKTTTIKTNKTVYCTLYFVKGKETLNLLQEKGGSTFKEQSGMWRFVGEASDVKNNYICFGTTIKDDCLANPKTYMYRIIGMTKTADNAIGLHAGQLKLIKATTLVDSKAWDSDTKSDIPWDSTELYMYLNGTDSGQFLYDIQHLTNGAYWEGLITSQKWYIQDQPSRPGATAEPTGKITTKSGKIGLMYGTDYMNAFGESTRSWLHLRDGWSGNSITLNEWTMTRYGKINDTYYAFYVNPDRQLYFSNGNLAVRPVFYLKSNVLLSGSGDTNDPFRIAG